MQSFKVQAAGFRQHAEAAPIVQPVATQSIGLKQLVAFFTRALRLHLRYEDDIASRYAGCGWSDTTERQMVDDIAAVHCSRPWR